MLRITWNIVSSSKLFLYENRCNQSIDNEEKNKEIYKLITNDKFLDK